MPRPVVSDTTEEIYAGLGPMTNGDEDTDWTLLLFVDSVGRLLHDVELLARDTEDVPGWSSILDPDAAPVVYLPWLAQFVGVSWAATPTEANQRLRIANREGQARGTLAALIAAVQSTLDEPKQVTVDERYLDDAYRLRVVTYTSQTPDSDATLAAILRQKPAGIVLEYDVVDADSIDALVGTIDEQVGDIDDL